MNDHINDAIDEQIQDAIGRSRESALRRLQPQAAAAPTVQGVDEQESMFEQMVAEDEEAERAKKAAGGGGGGGALGSILGAVMGG